LLDGVEVKLYCTSPLRKDTDNDNMDDYFEISNGWDPLTPDTAPPNITSIQIPTNITIGDNVTILANVSDDTAVANVLLYYSDGFSWSYKCMAFENGIYMATLYNVKNTTYSVKVVAMDYSGNTQESQIYKFSPTTTLTENQTTQSQGEEERFDFITLIIYVSVGVGVTLILVAVVVYLKYKKR
ncbi:hypothetical protein DRJ22_05740, partial [Candidatus Woesearchaeota archaeon]